MCVSYGYVVRILYYQEIEAYEDNRPFGNKPQGIL